MDSIDNYMAQYKKQNEYAVYRLWQCSFCSDRFADAPDLEGHLRACHKDAFEPILCFHDNAQKETYRWACSDCHTMYVDIEDASAHQIKTGHTIRSIPQKPPLGLIPRHIRDDQRIEEIKQAITRFVMADKIAPDEWFEELAELCARRVKRNV